MQETGSDRVEQEQTKITTSVRTSSSSESTNLSLHILLNIEFINMRENPERLNN